MELVDIQVIQNNQIQYLTYDCWLISEDNLSRHDISPGNHISANGLTFANVIQNITMVSCSRLIVLIPVDVRSRTSIPTTVILDLEYKAAIMSSNCDLN